MTFGEFMVAALPYIEGLLALVLGGGWFKTWRTMKAAVKAADLANDASAVALLEKDIERKINELKSKDEKIALLEDKVVSYQTMVESERVQRMGLFSKSVQMGMTMCVHLGCPYRKPGAGQGMQWYDDHKGEANLGADTLGIDDIVKEHTTQSNG